jgi:triacylglycerol lipase
MTHCLRKPSAMPRLALNTLSRSSMIAARRIGPKRGLKQETFAMSFLVELPQELFPVDALDGLDTAAKTFKLENAQALMWMSQLAYETAHEGKVNDILKTWNMTRLAFGASAPVTRLPPESACFVVAEKRGATIVDFAGTDPLKIEDWIKDFTLAPEPNVLHLGFRTALDAVWPTIEEVIKRRPEQPLFFTGHSMGAALALLGAEHALNRAGIMPTAVYTYGTPRTGGLDFFNSYAKLGDKTFRLVNGNDIVATVPPSANGNFRHVGQLLHCQHDGKFAGLTPTPSDQNQPDFNGGFLTDTARSDLDTVIRKIKALREGGLFAGLVARLLAPPTEALPSTIRDHIPASYFKALSIPLRQMLGSVTL